MMGHILTILFTQMEREEYSGCIKMGRGEGGWGKKLGDKEEIVCEVWK